MCICELVIMNESFNELKGAPDQFVGGSSNDQNGTNTRALLNALMLKSLVNSSQMSVSPEDNCVQNKTTMHLQNFGQVNAPVNELQPPVMNRQLLDINYLNNFMKYFNIFYPNLQNNQVGNSVSLLNVGNPPVENKPDLEQTALGNRNVSSGFSIANLLSSTSSGSTVQTCKSENISEEAVNSLPILNQWNTVNGLFPATMYSPDVILALNKYVQGSLADTTATSSLNIPNTNIPFVNPQKFMTIPNNTIAFHPENSPTNRSSTTSPTQNSRSDSPLVSTNSACVGASSSNQKNRQGTKSDDNSPGLDDDWLRNLIKTAGAVIRPGKPTSYFQLRQRRDSAEITSLAKDLESRKKRFACSYPNCNKAYYKKSHLKEHSYIHTGDKPYLCSQPGCGARFTRADQLSRHRRAHTGERNFCCLVCSKRFKRSDHLKVHLARHAGQNNLDTRSLIFGQTIPK